MTRHIPLRILMNFRMDERVLRSAAGAAAGRRVAHFLKQLAQGFRQRRQIAALAALDDRTLQDIGLSRGDVQEFMRQPFWAFRPLEQKRWRQPGDQCRDALARLDDNQICNLSETGQRLRREARRPR